MKRILAATCALVLVVGPVATCTGCRSAQAPQPSAEAADTVQRFKRVDSIRIAQVYGGRAVETSAAATLDAKAAVLSVVGDWPNADLTNVILSARKAIYTSADRSQPEIGIKDRLVWIIGVEPVVEEDARSRGPRSAYKLYIIDATTGEVLFGR